MERYAERDLIPGGREMPPQDMLGAPPSAKLQEHEVAHNMEGFRHVTVERLKLQGTYLC